MARLLEFDEVYDKGRFQRLIDDGLLIDISKLPKGAMASEAPERGNWEGKRVIVTGGDGMVGSTMADMLVKLGSEVTVVVKRHAVSVRPNIDHLIAGGKIKAEEADLCDYGRVCDIVRSVDPHVVMHQAAESFVPTSIQQPGHVVHNNCVSTVNVLDACAKNRCSLEGIQLACSSEEYGYVVSEDEIPVTERRELRPTSTYAVTKVFTEYIGQAYYHMYGLPTVMTRSFNQEGPRRGPNFFTARIARQVVDIMAGRQKELIMGNPNAVRDFTHIHDSAAAQLLAVERCDIGEVYNICSGIGITTGDYARLALNLYSLFDTPILVNPELLRNYERNKYLFDGFIGDNSKFRSKTGWRPCKTVVDIITDGVRQHA